jgi:hypothetical protein
MTMPRRDSSLYLRRAEDAHVRKERTHQGNGRSSLDARHVGRLVMRATLTNRYDRALDQSSYSLDYVAIGHRDANDWDASS